MYLGIFEKSKYYLHFQMPSIDVDLSQARCLHSSVQMCGRREDFLCSSILSMNLICDSFCFPINGSSIRFKLLAVFSIRKFQNAADTCLRLRWVLKKRFSFSVYSSSSSSSSMLVLKIPSTNGLEY